MPYDVTTIGNLLGSCDCGKPRTLDIQRIAGVAETAGGVFDRLNPFSDDFWVKELARRAAAAAMRRAEQAADALKSVDPGRGALVGTLNTFGVPTWGYQRDLITGAVALGALAVGGVLIARAVKKKRNSARTALRRKGK
jgi:hypothetical protein